MINKQFSMVAYNLGTFETTEAHTAEHLRNHIYQVLVLAGIIKRSDDGQRSTHELEEKMDDEEMICECDDEECEVTSPQETSDDDSDDNLLPRIPDQLTIDTSLRDVSLYITTDNASNITKAIEKSQFTHIKCFAHTVNLAVHKGLDVTGIKKQLGHVRHIVKAFRKSNKAKYSLQVSRSNNYLCYVGLLIWLSWLKIIHFI